MTSQDKWWRDLDEADRNFFIGLLPPSVMWCPECRLLVVAFYAGHCEDLCQHCGSVCEYVSACTESESWRISTPSDPASNHIEMCPGSLTPVLRGDYATCICGQQFMLVRGLIPNHPAKQTKPDEENNGQTI